MSWQEDYPELEQKMLDLIHRFDWIKSELGNTRNDNRRIEKKHEKFVADINLARASAVWKSTTVVLSSILITGLLSWISFGGGMSQKEGKEMFSEVITSMKLIIEEHAKHPHDMSAQKAELNMIEKRLDRMESKIDSLIK